MRTITVCHNSARTQHRCHRVDWGRNARRSATLTTVVLIAALGCLNCVQPTTTIDELAPEAKTPVLPGLRFIRLPGGEFLMGSPDGDAPNEELQELELRRKVIIEKPFEMTACEITKEQFRVFAAATGLDWDEDTADSATTSGSLLSYSALKTNALPAVNVTWEEANAFCRWLSNKTQQTYRLPTEAEWEYACRANSETTYCYGNSPFDLGDYAWYSDNAHRRCHPVGEKKPNKWGFYDMHGNVWEWCSDMVPQKYLRGSPWANQEVAKFRGGSYINKAADCRSACAWGGFPLDVRRPEVGFRVVREIKSPADRE